MISSILYGFLASLAMIAPVFIFGFFIAMLNRTFYRLAGRGSRAVCYITGVFGTPIHELSHASMCVLFGHKIKEIKLFQIDSADGVLGYVRHSYNKKNLYHRIGNFFIGIAPIVIGSLFLTALMFLAVRPMFLDIVAQTNIIGGGIYGETDALGAFSAFFSIFAIFFIHANNGWWWGYLAFSAAVALHMNLSKSDIKGSKEGLFVLIGVLFGICFILGLISVAALSKVIVWFLYIAIVFSLILFQSFFLSALWVFAAFLIRSPSLMKASAEKSKRERQLLELHKERQARTKEVSPTKEYPLTRSQNESGKKDSDKKTVYREK